MKSLEKMNLDELKALKADVDAAITSFQERQRKEAMAAAEEAANKHGYTVADLLKSAGKKGKARKTKEPAPAKYAHPKEPGTTWTGRGRKPKWFADLEAAGTSPESMLISA